MPNHKEHKALKKLAKVKIKREGDNLLYEVERNSIDSFTPAELAAYFEELAALRQEYLDGIDEIDVLVADLTVLT